jgi:hypothetical protein
MELYIVDRHFFAPTGPIFFTKEGTDDDDDDDDDIQ